MKKTSVLRICTVLLGVLVLIVIGITSHRNTDLSQEELEQKELVVVANHVVSEEEETTMEQSAQEEMKFEPYYDDRKIHPEGNETCNFSILILNQSFEIPSIDLKISIDDVEVSTDRFLTEDQHNAYYYYFNLEGTHTINFTTEEGTEVYEEMAFEPEKNQYMIVLYWGKDEEGKEILEVDISDEPILIK